MWVLCFWSQSGFPCNRFFCGVIFSRQLFSVCWFFLLSQLGLPVSIFCTLAVVNARLFSLAMVFLVVVSCSQSSYNIGGYFSGVVFPARFSASAPITFFSSVGFFCQPCGLTKRAPDKWESARFMSIFLASSFFCSQTESTPAHLQVTQTVGLPLA